MFYKVSTIGYFVTSASIIPYNGLLLSNLLVFPKEKVCFVEDLFREDPLISLKEATELITNLYFIKFIKPFQ